MMRLLQDRLLPERLPWGSWLLGIAVIGALVAPLLQGDGARAAKPKSPLCPGAFYLLETGGPLVRPDGTTPAVADAVAFFSDDGGANPRVALLSGCSLQTATVKATRKGTRLRARWRPGACPGVAGAVRVRAVIGPACTAMRGRVKVGRAKRAFTAARFEGTVVPALDAAAAASAEIGEPGGSVVATGSDGTRFTLTVPPGALLEPVTITLTPVTSVEKLPLTGGLLGAVDLAPEGLLLFAAATLTIEPPAPVDLASVVAFGWQADGMDFHLALSQVVGPALTIWISHFSGAGAGPTAPPTRPALGGGWTAASGPYRNQIIALLGTSAPPTAYLSVMYDWFDIVVLSALASASTSDAALSSALRRFRDWIDAVLLLSLFGDPGIDSRENSAKNQLVAPLVAAIDRANQRCTTQQSFAAADDALRWQRTAGFLGIANGPLALDAVLAGLCLQVTYEDIQFPLSPMAGRNELLALTVGASFGGGPAVFTQPLSVSVNAQGATPTSASGQTMGQGQYQATFVPTGGVDVSLTIDSCIDAPMYPRLKQVCQTALVVRGLQVIPPMASVAAGGRQQFTAERVGAPYGNVTWSATGGSVDQAGLYTAGQAPGMFSVTATDNANPGSSASAVVTVGSVTTTTTAVTTTTLAVDVQIYGRVAGAGAQAGVYDSGTQETAEDSQSSSLPDGDFVSPFSGNASATAAITGGSAQASGSASGTTTFDAKDRFIGAGGNGSGSSTCSVAAGMTCLPTSGSGQHSFFFEVSGGSVPYSITASVSGGGNGVAFVRLSPAGPGSDPFNFNSQTSAGGSQSGTLGPGQYSFTGVASAPAAGNSSSAGMSYQFALGPLP